MNTGVFFMHVPRFEAEWTGMLAYGRAKGFHFPAYDQGWLNAYLRRRPGSTAMLPVMWSAYHTLQTRVPLLHDATLCSTRMTTRTPPRPRRLEGLLPMGAATEGRACPHRPLPRVQAGPRAVVRMPR